MSQTWTKNQAWNYKQAKFEYGLLAHFNPNNFNLCIYNLQVHMHDILKSKACGISGNMETS